MMERETKAREQETTATTRRWRRYSVAVGATVVAALVRWALGQAVGEDLPPYITFYPAVIAAAMTGGTWPGVLATSLSVLAVDLLFLEPVGKLGPATTGQAVGMGLFIAINLAISIVGGRLTREMRQRQAAQEEVRASEERLRMAQQAAHIGAFEWNVHTGVNTWTPELEAMYGLKPGEFGRTQPAWEQLVHPEDRARAVGAVKRAFETFQPEEGEWRVIWPDGAVHWLVGRFQVFKDHAGKPLRLVGVNLDITERKRAQEALRQSEEQFHTMADAIPQLAWIARPDGHIFWYNRRCYEYTGATPEQLEGWGWQSVADPQALPEGLEQWRRSIATGQPLEIELPLRGADGSFRPFLTRVIPLKDNEGRVIRWFGTNTDISGLKQAQEDLRQSEERYRALVAATSDVVYRMSPDWSEMRQLRGRGFIPDAEAPNRNWLQDYIYPEDQPHVMAVINEAIRTKTTFELEHRVRRADGTIGWTFSRAIPLQDANGTIVEWFGAASDATQRKQAELAIARRNALLEGINGLFEKARHSRTEEEFCEACLRVVESVTDSKISFVGEIGPDGFLHDLAISNPGWDACKMYDQGGHRKPPGNFPIHGIYGRVMADEKGLIANNPASHPDRIGLPEGHPPLTSFLGVPLRRGGKVVGMIGVGNREGGYRSEEQELLEAVAPALVEALDRKRAEEALKKQARLIDLAPAATLVRTLDGTITFWSEGAQRLYGWTANEAVGRCSHDLLRTQFPEPLENIVEHLRQGGQWSGELRHSAKDGRRIIAESHWLAQFTLEGQPLELLESNIDITERKRNEEDLRALKDELELRVKQRTAELTAANGELTDFATIVSHDLKTPLRGVATLAKWLQSDYADKLDDEGRTNLADMVKRVTWMDRMIEDILQYSRLGRTQEKPEPVALAQLVPEVIENLHPPPHVRLHVAPDLPLIQGEPVRLRQLFQNLIGNAIKYGDKPQMDIRVDWADGRTAWEFSISDNGPGIEERHFERIFRIFQTLAPKDKTDSTGVGLALVKRIVERAGGRVWLDSRLGQGTTFHFTWPKRPQPAATETPQSLAA